MINQTWTITELADAIEKSALDAWSLHRYPILLSQLGMELSKRGDYQSVISPLKLRQFIATQLSDKVVLITHPKQPQKIAVIPVGQQFSFVGIEEESAENADAESEEKIKPSIWAAFVKPLFTNTVRFLDVGDDALRFSDLPSGSPPPSSKHKIIPSEAISDGRAPDYDSKAVAATIKAWAAENGLPLEKLLQKRGSRSSAPSSISFFDVFRGLSDSDLRRIEIPFDIIMKLAKR